MTLEKDIGLGEFLRQEREQRGITIEQVASATKVGVRTLHALEADQYVELPAKPFIRGFVTSYCRFVGLDAKEVLVRFDQFITVKSNEQRPRKDGGHSGYAFEKRDGDQQSRTFLFFAIFGFILIGGVTMLIFKPSLHSRRHKTHIEKLKAAHSPAESIVDAVKVNLPVVKPEGPVPLVVSEEKKEGLPGAAPSSGPVATESVPEPEVRVPEVKKVEGEVGPKQEEKVSGPSEASHSEEAASDSAEATPAANKADPLDSGLDLKSSEIQQKVIFTVLEDVWVRYRVDVRPVRKFIIRKGRSLVLRGRDQILFQVSNPNSVTVKYNGQGLGPMGSIHHLVHRKGTPTLVLPRDRIEKVEIPFSDAPLPKTPEPSTKTEAFDQDSKPAE